MAKKQTLSILEAHLEKIALGAALAVCLAVIILRLILGSGINGQSVSDATADTARTTDDFVQQIRQGPEGPERTLKLPEESIVKVDPIVAQDIDKQPFDPPPVEGEVGPNLEPMHIPGIPALTDVILDITHHQAEVPIDYNASNIQVEDVDFVTVEARFNIAQLRESFRQVFGDRQTFMNPVVFPEPIIGMVDLQHAQLQADGSWGDWESTDGLKNYYSRKDELLVSNMTTLSEMQYEVLLRDQMDPEIQAQALRAPAYRLVNATWQPPQESRLAKAQVEANRNRGRTSRSRTQTQTTQPDPSGSANRALTGLPGVLPDEPQDWLSQDEVRIWAHDGDILPNEYYRFRMRIGVFNPIAGKDWFTADQQHLKNEILLWSDWVSPGKYGQTDEPIEEEYAQVPSRVVFFPLPAGTTTNRKTARVEVFRWQQGEWNQRSFTIGPGSAIGELYTPPASEDDPDPKTIDYRTGATLVDIIPDRKHVTGDRSLDEVITYDLVYKDAGGTVRWLGANQKTWPESLRQKRIEISQAMQRADR